MMHFAETDRRFVATGKKSSGRHTMPALHLKPLSSQDHLNFEKIYWR